MSNPRRTPRQERAELRLAQLLEAAASVMAEVGYEAATMTAIAERAGASIGTLYQYFPDKDAVLAALRAQYVEEFQEHWAAMRAEGVKLSVRQLVDRIVDGIAEYIERRPAYLPLMTMPRKSAYDQGARNRLRENLLALLRDRKPEMGRQEALRIATVTVQTLKGMNPLLVDADAGEKAEIVREFKAMLFGYFSARLK